MGGAAQAFRVVTPPARQGAALEEYGGPDAGTIVNGVFFYVEYFPGLHFIHLLAL